MDDISYRRLPAIANSDLTELLALKVPPKSTKKPPKPETLQFGTTFHQYVLEPAKAVDWSLHHVTERAKMMQMYESFMRKTVFFRQQNPQPWEIERIMQRHHPDTGLPLKCRIDALTQHRVIDLKTTSCKSSSEFWDTFIEYGYDRQAAFYLDMVPGFGYDFTFIGVQKCKPFDVFIVDMSQSGDRRKMIDEGRRKNERLLRVAKEELDSKTGWRPSSWSRTE